MTAPRGRGRGAPRAAQWRKQTPPIWRAPASVACRGADTSLFYKGEQEGQSEREARAAKAKSMCRSCALRAECLEAAMEEERGGGNRFGIRGGLTEEERKREQVRRTLRARNARKREEAEEKETGEAA